jgi:hypothetical protein
MMKADPAKGLRPGFGAEHGGAYCQAASGDTASLSPTYRPIPGRTSGLLRRWPGGVQVFRV